MAWPGASVRDIIEIGPLGSRSTENHLLYNRRTGEVVTGVRGATSSMPAKACYKGTLAEFADAVEKTYASRVTTESVAGYDYQRYLIEYRQVIQFLSALPPLPETPPRPAPVITGSWELADS